MLIGSMGWGTYRTGMASNRHAHQGTNSMTLLKFDHHGAQALILTKPELIESQQLLFQIMLVQ